MMTTIDNDEPEGGLEQPPVVYEAKRAMDVCVGLWVTRFTQHHGLDHPDLGTPDQIAHDLEVRQAIRKLFRDLTDEEAQDPTITQQTRAAAETLITRELRRVDSDE